MSSLLSLVPEPGPLLSLLHSRTSALGRWLRTHLPSPGHCLVPHVLVSSELSLSPSALTCLLRTRVFEPLLCTSPDISVTALHDSDFPDYAVVCSLTALHPAASLSFPETSPLQISPGSTVLSVQQAKRAQKESWVSVGEPRKNHRPNLTLPFLRASLAGTSPPPPPTSPTPPTSTPAPSSPTPCTPPPPPAPTPRSTRRWTWSA